jgi:hypothetical protein
MSASLKALCTFPEMDIFLADGIKAIYLVRDDDFGRQTTFRFDLALDDSKLGLILDTTRSARLKQKFDAILL